MKLIDEKEIEDAASEWASGHGTQTDAIKFDFKSGAALAESKLRPMIIEFAEWLGRSTYCFHIPHGIWIDLYQKRATTEQLLEQFLTEYHETTKK